MKRSVLVLLALIAFFGASFAQADQIYCKITGLKQGPIAGDVTIKGLEDTIAVQTVSQGVKSPRDAASGQATGKRQHKPFTIVKGFDKASPKLFMAAVTNENLTSVECSFFHTNRFGQNQKYFKITLQNAQISEIDIANNPQHLANIQQTVSFVFQKIILEDPINGIIAEDDWEAST